jgi:hypothetical protein
MPRPKAFNAAADEILHQGMTFNQNLGCGLNS